MPKTHTKKISHINKPCKKIIDSLLPLWRDVASRIHQIAEHEQNTGTNMEKRSKLLAHNYSKFEKKISENCGVTAMDDALFGVQSSGLSLLL